MGGEGGKGQMLVEWDQMRASERVEEVCVCVYVYVYVCVTFSGRGWA